MFKLTSPSLASIFACGVAMNSGSWREQVVLVTGGTSGIGLAVGRAFHQRGAQVLVCARTAAALEAVVRENGFARGYVCDVTKFDDICTMMSAIAGAFGRLDVLVANTGGLRETDFTAAPLDPDVVEASIQENLTGPIQLVNQALPLLRGSQRPRIVMVSSGFGWSPCKRAPLYAASKAGIRFFVKALRMQLAPHGFQVLEAVPPVVDTPATAHRSVGKISPAAMAEAIVDALGRGKPEAFAGQTRFLPLMLRLIPGIVERMTGKS